MYFFANLKMYCSYEQTIALTQDYAKLAQELTNIDICLLPAAELIFPTAFAASEELAIGAQTCSVHDSGAHTGQVSPLVLQELGCEYCLVGHSEVRKAYGETDEMVAKKSVALVRADIIPIICVGEKECISTAHATSFVQAQLEPVITALKKIGSAYEDIIIAYEPIWAISTSESAPIDHISTVSNAIYKQMTQQLEYAPTIVYGGSVHEQNIQIISSIETIDGVLVGRASTDFQTTRKMLQLLG